MATVSLQGITHDYGGAFLALKKMDFEFREGTTYALLGPSGCGKTTLLNVISGLVVPSGGRILYDGVDVTDRPPRDRNIAQVFQFPVIYRTKTVFENLAFPLRCRGVSRREIQRRVTEVARILGIESKLANSARKLSADEKQLVSLGRGLVREDVSAVMMDEPLTVIDPQQKGELRKRIKLANEKTRHTVIYVTHDQSEAMTFADVVLVMKDGELVQAGGSEELFRNPVDTYVGRFIGSPGMNFVPLSALVDAGAGIDGPLAAVARTSPADDVLGVRPEHVVLDRHNETAQEWFDVAATIAEVENRGVFSIISCRVGEEVIKARAKTRDLVIGQPARLSFRIADARIYRDGKLLVAPR